MTNERFFSSHGRCTAIFALLVFSGAGQAASHLNWIQLTPAASPTARSGCALAYDRTSKKIVLFGGYSGTAYLNDTWTFDGVTWTHLAPSLSPPARTASTMAYDNVDGEVMMFGGYNSPNYLGDTWLFDGTTGQWTQASPGNSPPAVTLPSSFTDPLNGHADVFGGYDGRFYQLGTWQWSGSTWLQLHPATSPYARAGAIAALDHANKTAVLFGGLGDLQPDNTWTWDGTNWTQQFPAVQRPLVYFSAGAYDPRHRAVVTFGGGSGGVDMNQTWSWNGTTWIQNRPGQSPPARELFGMTYDEALGHIVIFGGQAGSNMFNDTWELTVQ